MRLNIVVDYNLYYWCEKLSEMSEPKKDEKNEKSEPKKNVHKVTINQA